MALEDSNLRMQSVNLQMQIAGFFTHLILQEVRIIRHLDSYKAEVAWHPEHAEFMLAIGGLMRDIRDGSYHPMKAGRLEGDSFKIGEKTISVSPLEKLLWDWTNTDGQGISTSQKERIAAWEKARLETQEKATPEMRAWGYMGYSPAIVHVLRQDAYRHAETPGNYWWEDRLLLSMILADIDMKEVHNFQRGGRALIHLLTLSRSLFMDSSPL